MGNTDFIDAICPECAARVQVGEVPKPGGLRVGDGFQPKEAVCENGHKFEIKRTELREG